MSFIKESLTIILRLLSIKDVSSIADYSGVNFFFLKYVFYRVESSKNYLPYCSDTC